MPILVSCPKCKKRLKINDTAAGKNIKCPGCAHVFKAAATPADIPPSQSAAAPVGSSKADTRRVEPAARSRPTPSSKKKSSAPLYGCLAGSCLFLLLIGAGVYWLYHKGKEAWDEAQTLPSAQPTTQLIPQRQVFPPPGSESRVEKPVKTDQQPFGQNPPEKPPDPAAIEAAIKSAGSGVKLAKFDLTSKGLNLLIEAPEGATVEQFLDEVKIEKGDNFALKITAGTAQLDEKLNTKLPQKVHLHTENVFLIETNRNGSPHYEFGLNVSAGYRSYYIENGSSGFDKSACLFMIKCARTLAPNKPLPADPVAALEAIKVEIYKDEAGKVTSVKLDSRVSKDVVKLVRQLPQLQSLSLSNAPIDNDALAQLAGLVHLTTLHLSGTPITDEGLKHLARMTELEDILLDSPEIKGPGLVHLAGLNKLKKMHWLGETINDTSLPFLQNVKSLQTLTLSSTSVTGSGLTVIKKLPKLTFLMLSGCEKLSEEGLPSLSGSSQLEALVINSAPLLGSGFNHLRDLKKLNHLDLSGCKLVSDNALEHIGKMETLTYLSLGRTGISDAGLAHLKGLKELHHLNLDETKVSDAGLVHLKGFSKLTTVELRNAAVTDKGVQDLKKALPRANIYRSSN